MALFHRRQFGRRFAQRHDVLRSPQKELPGDPGKELSARLPWHADWYYNNIFLDADISWSQVQEGFAFLLQKHPRSTRTKSAYALFAGMAEQRDICKRLLDELGDQVDMQLSVNWGQIDKAKQWALNPAKTPPNVLRPADSEKSED